MKNTFICSCGKTHNALIDDYLIQRGAIRKIPEYVRSYGAKKCFLICDKNTYQAAGRQVEEVLALSGIPYCGYCYGQEVIPPNEESVGSAIMHFDHSCDFVIGIGSGVINDIGKILSKTAKTPYMIVATAPSMDGYASASSSMTRDGLKISLPSQCANVIIGDLDVLCQAPLKMMKSGLGDMLAKYVSICEWRISHLITGEYYCEEIAKLIREAVQRCVENANGLLSRDERAVAAVFEGLVIGGVAMNYAGVSRPASGVEHYISHVLDMRTVEFGEPEDFHGIQCAIGTLIATRLYEKLKTIAPDKEKALSYVENFSWEDWQAELRSFLGKGAESMIALEAKEQKYDKERHKERLEIILQNLDGILQIMDEELPPSEDLERLLNTIDAPKTLEEIGISSQLIPMIFKTTKDIRDKYVLSRLAWDLGVLDEIV